jgi:RNA polymerase primary sigma factor
MAAKSKKNHEDRIDESINPFLGLDDLDNEKIKSQLEVLSHEDIEPTDEIKDHKGLDDSVQLYLKSIGRIPLLGPDDEIHIAREIASEDLVLSKKACNKLVQANLRLVVAIAKRYASHSIPLLDLIQEGNTGLMKAAQKFDYELGYRFSTYATWWIKQAITRSINEKERPIKIPAHALEQISRLKKIVANLTTLFGRAPTDKEISEGLDFAASDVRLWKEIDSETLSLESPISKDNEGTLSEIISDLDEKTPEHEYQQKALRGDLVKLLDVLDEEERKIIELRFAFNETERFHSIEEVSAICNINRDKVRKIEFKALRKMRNYMDGAMKDYLHFG